MEERTRHRTYRRGWHAVMRFKLVARDALIDAMTRQGWSNRGLAEYVGCAPGTIDNLVACKTQSVSRARTARLICRALDVPVEVFFTPIPPSVARHVDNRKSIDAVGGKGGSDSD